MHSLLRKGGKVKMGDRISNLNMEVNGIYIYKNNHMVLDLDKIVSNIIDELKAENKRLKADNVAYVNDFAKLIKENDKLKADNKKAREYIVHVEKENDTLKYEHTMFHAKEWFDNNSKCNKVYVFVLDADGVNDDGWIADSHAVVSVNDGNCVGSYDRKVIDNS